MIKEQHFKSKELQDSSKVEDIDEKDETEVREEEEEVTLTEEMKRKQIQGDATTARKLIMKEKIDGIEDTYNGLVGRPVAAQHYLGDLGREEERQKIF